MHKRRILEKFSEATVGVSPYIQMHWAVTKGGEVSPSNKFQKQGAIADLMVAIKRP